MRRAFLLIAILLSFLAVSAPSASAWSSMQPGMATTWQASVFYKTGDVYPVVFSTPGRTLTSYSCSFQNGGTIDGVKHYLNAICVASGAKYTGGPTWYIRQYVTFQEIQGTQPPTNSICYSGNPQYTPCRGVGYWSGDSSGDLGWGSGVAFGRVGFGGNQGIWGATANGAYSIYGRCYGSNGALYGQGGTLPLVNCGT